MSETSSFNPVRYLTEDSRPIYLHYGEDFVTHKFPAGTRVIYANKPMKGIDNRKAAIRYALNHPEGGAKPLYAQLKPGMKVTIAIDDISVPLPPMKTPDIRQDVIEIVLQILTDHGVEDVEMIVALALHRPMEDWEIKRMVGAKVYNEYAPDRLYNMDGEDKENMVILGQTEEGED